MGRATEEGEGRLSVRLSEGVCRTNLLLFVPLELLGGREDAKSVLELALEGGPRKHPQEAELQWLSEGLLAVAWGFF